MPENGASCKGAPRRCPTLARVARDEQRAGRSPRRAYPAVLCDGVSIVRALAGILPARPFLAAVGSTKNSELTPSRASADVHGSAFVDCQRAEAAGC